MSKVWNISPYIEGLTSTFVYWKAGRLNWLIQIEIRQVISISQISIHWQIFWKVIFVSFLFFFYAIFSFYIWPCVHVCVFCSKKTPLSLSHRRCPTWPYGQSWHKASYIFSLSIWVGPQKQKNKHLLIIVNYSCQQLNKQQRHARRIHLNVNSLKTVEKTQERAERERVAAQQLKLTCQLECETAGMWVNSSFSQTCLTAAHPLSPADFSKSSTMDQQSSRPQSRPPNYWKTACGCM